MVDWGPAAAKMPRAAQVETESRPILIRSGQFGPIASETGQTTPTTSAPRRTEVGAGPVDTSDAGFFLTLYCRMPVRDARMRTSTFAIHSSY